MILGDIFDLINKDKRMKKRLKTAQKLAVGLGILGAIGIATKIIFTPKYGK